MILCTVVVLVHYLCKEVICRTETEEEVKIREERELQKKMMDEYKRNNIFEKERVPFAGRNYKGGELRKNTDKSNVSSNQ